jgi:hypothetical protein
MAISGKTKAALIRMLATESHSDINLLAIEVDLDGQAQGTNRIDRCTALVRAIENKYQSSEAQKILLELGETRLKTCLESYLGDRSQALALKRCFELDGYAFDGQRLLPAIPGPVALEKEISGLESSLAELGMKVALTHYQQAVDNFVIDNVEAANAQTRSFLENLFIALCSRHTARVFDNAPAALQHLKNEKWIDDKEWNHLRYFWADIQDNGPHQGLSSSAEAMFRIQVATAVARYLLAKKST